MAQSRLTASSCGRSTTGRSTDCWRDGCAAGATLIAATYPRAVVDLNRDASEQDPDSLLDPALLPGLRATLKARAGLGRDPDPAARRADLRRPAERHGAAAPAGRRPISPTTRGSACWPAEQRLRFGACLVLDCHSMPTMPPLVRGERVIDVALGDRFGRSCHPRLIETAERLLAAAGLKVARNRPYAGGHITERHGRPAAGSHALQLELRRGLFMHESTHEPNDGFAGLQALLGELVRALAEVVLELATPATAHPASGP